MFAVLNLLKTMMVGKSSSSWSPERKLGRRRRRRRRDLLPICDGMSHSQKLAARQLTSSLGHCFGYHDNHISSLIE